MAANELIGEIADLNLDEKGPPLPPKESLPWRAAALPATQEAPNVQPKDSSLAIPATDDATPPVEPRLKKKIQWKGKNILVLLPLNDGRGKQGKAPNPMSEKEVATMLREWEQLGYDTTGFNLGRSYTQDDEGSEGQSRSPWPYSIDTSQERQQRAFKVSIPDRREWDNYVDELQEAKLRALGVSIGNDEPVNSPATSNISRQTSMQYPPLPFSPPIPTSSAASTHHANPFSPVLMPGAGMSTSQSSNPGSIASPASMHAHLQGKYNPRQSVSFTSGDHPFGSPFQYPQQQSPGVWSPQQMLYQQGSRGVSPALQNLSSIISPSSPLLQEGYFPGDALSQMQQRQQMLQNQLHQQQQLQLQGVSSPRLQEVREAEDEETVAASKSPSKTPEARQIRHNPSASLQKEIEDAEYHLEEQIERELDHDDYSPHSDGANDSSIKIVAPAGLSASRYAVDSDEEPILHHPQPHSRGHSLSQRPFQDSEESAVESKSGNIPGAKNEKDASDIETNPSIVEDSVQPVNSSHERSISEASNPWLDSEPVKVAKENNGPGHSAKPSTSKLNVEAKEFKFEPSNTFKPTQFSFSGNNFQPPVTTYQDFLPNSSTNQVGNHSLPGPKSKINVTAPPFTPGQSEFSFSTSGPTFRPDAPAFTPSHFTESFGSGRSGSDGPRSSIFGNLDLSLIGISKPSKKSKAIPIIRPDSSHSKNQDDGMEGLDGRITRGEGRTKRARGGMDDGDSVALFAESMPLGETSREQSPPKETQSTPGTLADKENSALQSSDEIPDIPVKSESQNLRQSPDLEFAPVEFRQKKQAEDFNAARPFISRRYGSGLPGYGYLAPDEDAVSPIEEPFKPEPKKQHKKNSLSATAKPFEYQPRALNFKFGEQSQESPVPTVDVAPTKPSSGLSSSRFARSPTPESPELESNERSSFQAALPRDEVPKQPAPEVDREPTFEEIDAVMQQLNKADMESVPHDAETPWEQSPVKPIRLPDPDNSSPIRLQPHNLMRSDAPSPSPRRFQALPGEIVPQRIFSREHDPFVEQSPPVLPYPSPIHHLDNGAHEVSDWDDVLSETEDAKLQLRAQFLDSHVNELVGGLLAERLDPLERTLETIQMSLDLIAARAPSSRRERRSISGALSDADDEDDEEIPRRSLSPRRDNKLEKIRSIVKEALSAQFSQPPSADISDDNHVLQALQEMKEQFGQSMRLDLRGEDLRNIVEEAVEKRIPASPEPIDDSVSKAEREARIADLEAKLRLAEASKEDEVKARKNMEESIVSKTMETEAKITALEEKLSQADVNFEDQLKIRRAAEDRLAEVQRLLRISSEEEDRLREAMDEREVRIREIVDASDVKVRAAEDLRAKTGMKIALLEANQENAQKNLLELKNRLTISENELRLSRQEFQRLQIDAQRTLEVAKRHSEDAEQANESNKGLRKTLDSLRTQMEESSRVREGMRGKLISLQEDMAHAAREVSEENSRRAKREQELIARQEVLDAKLQAEARTRERLMTEIERLEGGEREGMRAVSESMRLEALVVELRNENHNSQKEAMRYKREFEEARESGMSEVQRTRHYMQAEIESANNQVNVVREDLENQLTRLRTELDQSKLDADTSREKHFMFLEEASSSKKATIEDLRNNHANEIEDLHTQHERQLNNALEDAQRHEQHLLERLSLSSAKTEHLLYSVLHLEEKLEIAKSAANAAANAARSGLGGSQPATQLPVQPTDKLRSMELPEKISPQALRETIEVLTEQLRDREQTIETLEQQVASLDPDAQAKISKRDDEILWLRELLEVRKSDLQDLVNGLESEEYGPEKVKDAAIRLRANLQMEEQERERAMNGGSALNLPNIAASLRDAATPRVAQAVGPLAAAWGNWRKVREASFSGRGETPSKGSPSNFLGGLLTPPTSSIRQSPTAQRTAFGNTGTRFTAQQLANRPRAVTPRARQKLPMRDSSPKEPSTPPMMRKSSYDNDALAAEFSDGGFYDDDESTVDDMMLGVGR